MKTNLISSFKLVDVCHPNYIFFVRFDHFTGTLFVFYQNKLLNDFEVTHKFQKINSHKKKKKEGKLS